MPYPFQGVGWIYRGHVSWASGYCSRVASSFLPRFNLPPLTGIHLQLSDLWPAGCRYEPRIGYHWYMHFRFVLNWTLFILNCSWYFLNWCWSFLKWNWLFSIYLTYFNLKLIYFNLNGSFLNWFWLFLNSFDFFQIEFDLF